MKKLLLYVIVISGGVAAVWHYLPQDSRNKTTAFIGSVLEGNIKKETEQFIGDKILPKDPEKRRSALLDELKNNLAELKNAETKTGRIKTDDNAEVLRVLQESDAILKQLESANEDASFGKKITDKILETVSPGRSDSGSCEIKK